MNEFREIDARLRSIVGSDKKVYRDSPHFHLAGVTREDGFPEAMAVFLKSLEGKKVIRVDWINEYDRDSNPDEVIGRFRVEIE